MTARPPAPVSLGRATMLVAEREITSQVRTRSFLVSTAILLVGVLAAIVVSSVLSGRDEDDVPVAVVEQVAGLVAGAEGIAPVEVTDRDAAERAVRAGDVDAAVVPAEGPRGLEVLAMQEAPAVLLEALTERPDVELLDPAAAEGAVRYAVTFGFGFVFMLSAIGFGATIAQNTVTEKQTRIVEILLSAVPARALLAGKILGNSALALGQTAAIAAVSVLALVVTGQEDVLTMVGMPLVWFVVFFALGFLLLAAMFAASASLVSRIEDTGVVLQPVMWLTMLPYFLIVFFDDNSAVTTAMSYVPFSAPVGMPVRLFLGEAAWWEPLLSLALLAGACALVVGVAARIYERSVLRMGARVKVGEVLRGAAD
ncbi:putative Na+ efflux ABC transporter, permease component [Cellulomonas flavigena DSM 20109]|uniref:Putative Na+ efflux ABC transporter, permease component n=1 Tax=Cellulomonas flavigena (strain ATCC 482 / DSM 20109 / BCRC 11376 / JCM 18109 / NBRC 3775 / NCIMB 8073 / NRS 134) TaxID=446466 RepID=D5UK27_CELFN|nr:ABC transporter permease [Cellulomonas flavigena]ADG73769.1 putative Na+ efflux ABC transporter, permease component [Cellulomonas flavigena DSM 20109]